MVIMLNKRLIKIFLVIICMTGIFCFSSDSASTSSKKSDGLIIKIGEFVSKHRLNSYDAQLAVEKFSFIVRKSAHFSIYFILGLLLISLVLEYIPMNKVSIIIALLISFLYAVSDEVHQYFVPGRSCEVRDVLIDTCGALLGIFIYSIFVKLRRKTYE